MGVSLLHHNDYVSYSTGSLPNIFPPERVIASDMNIGCFYGITYNWLFLVLLGFVVLSLLPLELSLLLPWFLLKSLAFEIWMLLFSFTLVQQRGLFAKYLFFMFLEWKCTGRGRWCWQTCIIQRRWQVLQSHIGSSIQREWMPEGHVFYGYSGYYSCSDVAEHSVIGLEEIIWSIWCCSQDLR